MQRNSLKIVAISALLLALAVALTPLIIGFTVREIAITDTIAMLPPEMQAQVEIRENAFSRGWMQSQAQLEMEFTPLGSLPLAVQLPMQIHHGPVLFTPGGLKFGLVYATIDPSFDSAEIRELLGELPFAAPQTTLSLHVGFTGSVRGNLQIEPIAHADGQGELDFSGLQANFLVYPDQSAELTMTMDRLNAQEYNSGLQLTVGGLDLHTTTTQLSDLLAPSAVHFRLDNVSSATPLPFALHGLAFESRIQPAPTDPQRTDIFERVEIARIDSDWPLAAITWSTEINETRNDLFRRYYVLLVQMQDELNQNDGKFTEQFTRSAEELALLLLQNTIVFNNAITATAYGGDHSADLRLHWRGLPGLANFASLDLNEALAALELTVDVSLDLDAMTRSPLADMIDPYVQQGYIQLGGGRITLRATLTDSRLVLNGEPMALDGLF